METFLLVVGIIVFFGLLCLLAPTVTAVVFGIIWATGKYASVASLAFESSNPWYPVFWMGCIVASIFAVIIDFDKNKKTIFSDDS